jgi:hypothetical protein
VPYIDHRRLRYRRRDMGYKDDLGDSYYVPPAAGKAAVARADSLNPWVREQAKRKSDLVSRLQAAAIQVGRGRPGGITSADVWAVLDDETKAEAKAEGRIMGAVFPTAQWTQTGEYRKTGSHGRPQPVWVLREAVAA